MPLPISPDAPFVLLDDARIAQAAPARLYRDPVEIIATRRLDEVPSALEALRTATRGGLHAAGFLAYEAGQALEPKAGAARNPVVPLIWFGLFRTVETVSPDQVPALLMDPDGAWAGTIEPMIDRAGYDAAIAQVKALIEAGDIYQANLTFRASVRHAGHPLALYAALRDRARAGYGGIVHTGQDWLLSLSPELFFSLDQGVLTTRPMKGTAPRATDPAMDAARATALAADPKQQAENLMIVDLLRNDLSRVSTPGSVAVPDLFRVETYPTVHQMTSTVRATLAKGHDAVDALTALFPCGSITGAPKIRAMQVIDAVEQSPRGIYTGTIGRIDPGAQRAAFNVAIRTLHIDTGGAASMGLGSGVVADSTAREEWAECLAKGRFVADPRRFDLIETMFYDAVDGFRELEAHLARMKESAAALGFMFDRHAARNELQAAAFRLPGQAMVRLLLSRSGAFAIETRPAPAAIAMVDVAIVPLPVDRHDFRLRHKTTLRDFYDAARRGAGDVFDVLFVDPDGHLTEGSFTSLFVAQGNKLATPPASLGLLPGILRQSLLASGRAHEALLRASDLDHEFYVGNSLRGLLPARLKQL